MNEQDRYRSSSQHGQNEGRTAAWQRGDERDETGPADRDQGEWQRDYGSRGRGQFEDSRRGDDLRGDAYSQRGNEYGQRLDGRRGQYGSGDQYGQNRSRDHFGSHDEGRGDVAGDQRYAAEGGFGQRGPVAQPRPHDPWNGNRRPGPQREYPQQSQDWGSRGAESHGSNGGFSMSRSSTLGEGLGGSAGDYQPRWGQRPDFIHENRGAAGPSYSRSQGQGAFANFGERTRGEANLYSGAQRQGHFGRGPKGYTRSDERIREDVCERLSENDEVDASDVEVTVKNREVALSGSVETRRMKHIAEDIADSVAGVEDVHNSISVRKAFLKEMADKIMGSEEPEHHHAHGGTKTTGATASAGSSSATSPGSTLGGSSSALGSAASTGASSTNGR